MSRFLRRRGLQCIGLTLVLLGGLCACRQQGSTDKAASSAAQPLSAAELPAWLNPLAQIGQSQRLLSGSGEDLRQAQYFSPETKGEPEILALMRNYQDRAADRPDQMRILRLLPGQSQPAAVPSSPDARPLRMVVSPDKREFAWCAWLQPAATPVSGGRVLLVSGSQSMEGAAEALTIPPADSEAGAGLWPYGFIGKGSLACREIQQMQLYNGLPMPKLKHGGQLQLYELRSSSVKASSSPLFLASPDGQAAAGFEISYDHSLPAQASITYQTGGAPGSRPRQLQRWALPYFVTYTPHDWEPSLAWADADSLVALAFQPDAMGPAEKPNAGGLFRLLRLDASDGSAQIVEDRVLATTGIVAGDGVVFFGVSPGPGSSGGGWELWASSVDGLHKQRLYGAMSTLGLEPVDLYKGRRLLVHHQFFDDAASTPVLRSALLEFNLDAPGAAVAPPVVQLDPLPQVQGIEEQEEAAAPGAETGGEDDGSGDLFNGAGGGANNKYEGDGGKDDGFIPDNPGDGAGDGGGSGDGGWDGGGGGSPPPINPG